VISGLTSPRSQAQVATHIATSSEPFLAAEGQHEGEGGDVALHLNPGFLLADRIYCT
jgi:hypothetical protein